MKILVTGGAGFIGSNYVRRLAQSLTEKHEIYVLDALTYSGNLANLGPVLDLDNVHFIHADIRNSDVVDSIMANVDFCVNFAAESHVDRSISAPTEVVNSNFIGALTLLESARKNQIKKFVQISTDEVYGSITHGTWTEESPLLPNSPYSASKAASDLLVRSYSQTFGMKVNITRCTNNYGPFQFPEKLIPLFITNLVTGKNVPVYGSGENIRDWLHVDDHCDAIDLVLMHGKSGEVYNIGGGLEISNIELTSKLLSALGFDESRINFVQDRKGHDLRYSMSYQKIAKDLGYSPKVEFENGFKDTIEWYLQNKNWWEPLLDKKLAQK
jgi:dTDP-glucose 4,6-dehydratase